MTPLDRISSIRIVRWYFKLAYAAGVWVAGYLVLALFDALGAPSQVGSITNATLTLAGFILGARWFRGQGEPIEPARPWWQMTARRTLSRVLGIIFLLTTISTALVIAAAGLGVESSVRTLADITLPEAIINAVLSGALAVLYMGSAARLPKPPQRAPEPQLKPEAKLK